jgi:hypothetical protein
VGLAVEYKKVRNNVAHGDDIGLLHPNTGQGSRLLHYDVVSDGEIFGQKVIDFADLTYGMATVIGSFFIGIHGYQGPATVVSILNAVIFQEEASLVQQHVARVWAEPAMNTAALLYKIQAHIAIPAVLDLVVSVPFVRWVLVIAYAVTMLVQLGSLLTLQLDDSVRFARLVTSALPKWKLQFSLVALRMLVAEKTGNFRMLMPAPSEGARKTLRVGAV